MTQEQLIIDEMIKTLVQTADISYQTAANQVEHLLESISIEVSNIRAARHA